VRLAFIGGFAFSPKGTIRARAHPLAAHMVCAGHEVTIFLTPYDNPDDCGRNWEQDGVRVRNMPGGSSYFTRFSWNKAALLSQLIKEVAGFRPDLIHVFKPKGFAGAAGTYFIKRRRCPVILDCDDWEGWSGWNDVARYPWLVKQYIDWQEQWMMKSATALTVASRLLERRAQGLRGTHNSVYYAPNGLSAAQIALHAQVQSLPRSDLRKKWNLQHGVVVLYSGHFCRDEDTTLLAHALSRLPQHSRATVALAGSGPELGRMQQAVSCLPHLQIRLFPQLGYQDFLEVVWASDIAVFPFRDDFRHRAKCSVRIIDYLSMGKAVLTSAVGQNREYIVHGESGLLATPEDENDFAIKLSLLVSDPRLCALLGRNARNRILKHFRWDGLSLRNCLAAYESALRV
jgi:glycosyltransferase involved in cell wall biosynthesis